MAAALALVLAPWPAGADARTWTSKDGRTMEGRGVHVSPAGVAVLREGETEPVVIPFEVLQEADARWAIHALPVHVNDDVRLSARTVRQNRSLRERDTGSFAVAVVGTFRYGTDRFETLGVLRPITEQVAVSGRVVEVTLSSLSGAGITAVEFYTIQGSGNRRRIHSIEVGIYEFTRTGSSIEIPTAMIEDFSGWAVVARSVNTGRVVDLVASLQPIEVMVSRRIPATVDFTADIDGLRRQLLDSIGLE